MSMSTERTAPAAKEAHLRSLAKAVSWRVVGSLDTFIISLVVTGNPVWAGTIASVEAFTKIALYYLHEQLGARLPWGRGAGQAIPTPKTVAA